MADYVTLLGAEQVANAASSIRNSADEMKWAVSQLDDVLQRNRMLLDELMGRFEAQIDRVLAKEVGDGL